MMASAFERPRVHLVYNEMSQADNRKDARSTSRSGPGNRGYSKGNRVLSFQEDPMAVISRRSIAPCRRVPTSTSEPAQS